MNLPWFLFDIGNKQLITSPFLPSDISDTKDIILSETPIAGLNHSPINYGGGGNRKISFELPLIKKNDFVGNVLMLKQFENLRNQQVGLTKLFSGQFQSNPKVLYYWGIGSSPLVWWVKSCKATHKQGWINKSGQPQYSEIQLELWLDETHPLYAGEEMFRKFESLAGMVQSAYQTYQAQKGVRFI